MSVLHLLARFTPPLRTPAMPSEAEIDRAGGQCLRRIAFALSVCLL